MAAIATVEPQGRFPNLRLVAIPAPEYTCGHRSNKNRRNISLNAVAMLDVEAHYGHVVRLLANALDEIVHDVGMDARDRAPQGIALEALQIGGPSGAPP